MCSVEENQVSLKLTDGNSYSLENVTEAHYDVENLQYEFEHKDGRYTIINTAHRLDFVQFGKNVKRHTY